MTKPFQRFLISCFLAAGFAVVGGCGGGGSTTSSTPPPPPPPPACSICFTPATGAVSNVVLLSLNSASTASTAIFDLTGAGLNTTSAYGISADLIFDHTWMTFAGFTPDTGTNGVSNGLASVLESDSNTLVIGLYKFKGTPAHLGTLTFNLSSTGKTATLSFSSSSTYIGSPAVLLPSPQLAALGGALKN